MLGVTNIWMDGHLHDEHKDGHLLNNFVLHNELPILHRSKFINIGNQKKSKFLSKSYS